MRWVSTSCWTSAAVINPSTLAASSQMDLSPLPGNIFTWTRQGKERIGASFVLEYRARCIGGMGL